MTEENSSSVERLFGRIEKQLDTIDGKLDRHSETIAEHGVRIGRAEDDIRVLRDERMGETNQRITLRQLLIVAVLTTLGGGGVTLLANLLTAHH